MPFMVTSDAFSAGGAIPSRFTCEGEDVSPPLAWSGAPLGVASFALTVDDPDAPGGVFTHWVLYNLPATSTRLPQGVPARQRVVEGGLQGKNDFGRTGYDGPCPPPGRPHHYRFTLYALDATLGLQAGAAEQDVLNAIRGHVLGQAQLVGTYQRQR
jgi:Raf kinase inhibitor-like YbhB/YbcL family protein